MLAWLLVADFFYRLVMSLILKDIKIYVQHSKFVEK